MPDDVLGAYFAYDAVNNRYTRRKDQKGAAVLLVISERPYVASAALGAKVKGNDYRSIDIGILSAYITAEATAQGLSTCILGWLDDKKLRELCHLDQPVRLVITLGYAREGDVLRAKKRKELADLVNTIE